MDLLFSGIIYRRFWDRTLYVGEYVATRLYDYRVLFGRFPVDTLSNQDENWDSTLDHLSYLNFVKTPFELLLMFECRARHW